MHFWGSSAEKKLPLGVCSHFWLSLESQGRRKRSVPTDEEEVSRQPPRVDSISYGVEGPVGAEEMDGMAEGAGVGVEEGAGDTVGGGGATMLKIQYWSLVPSQVQRYTTPLRPFESQQYDGFATDFTVPSAS